MRFSHRKGLIDRESFVAQYLALAIFTIGIVSTLGADDLLAAFAAGSAVSWDGHFNEQTEGEVFASVIDLVLNCARATFVLTLQMFNYPTFRCMLYLHWYVRCFYIETISKVDSKLFRRLVAFPRLQCTFIGD